MRICFRFNSLRLCVSVKVRKIPLSSVRCIKSTYSIHIWRFIGKTFGSLKKIPEKVSFTLLKKHWNFSRSKTNSLNSHAVKKHIWIYLLPYHSKPPNLKTLYNVVQYDKKIELNIEKSNALVSISCFSIHRDNNKNSKVLNSVQSQALAL